jgi:hypothetical protein
MQTVLTRALAAAREAQDSAAASGAAASLASLQQVASLVESKLGASTGIVSDMQKVLGRVEAATASGASSAARWGVVSCGVLWGVMCGCAWCVVCVWCVWYVVVLCCWKWRAVRYRVLWCVCCGV